MHFTPHQLESARRYARRTEQEISPHPQLVDVRKRVEAACGLSRRDAAAACNLLTNAQCDKILAAKNDAAVQKIVAHPRGEAPEPDERRIRDTANRMQRA